MGGLIGENENGRVLNSYATGSMQGALVAMEPGTGLVRAMVGGTDFKDSQFNRAAIALRLNSAPAITESITGSFGLVIVIRQP